MAKKAVLAPRSALGKLTYGYNLDDLKRIDAIGLDVWLDDQLSPNAVRKAEDEIDFSAFRSAKMSITEIYRDRVFKGRPSLLSTELVHMTLLRRLFSSRQVYEMLVEHFSDYIPVDLYTDKQLVRLDYDTNVIRANVLGYYPKMVAAATFHPAMLNYLNGDTNTASNSNENYGRELLELFTVTPSAGYDEHDVKQAAKLLSGITWNVATDDNGVSLSDHYFGEVNVFGFKHPNAPTDSQHEVIQRISNMVSYLALRPETARAFSKRMARRFVSDNPSEALLKSMAATYTRSKGHIPSVFKTMVKHQEFAKAAATKVKRPMEHLGSTVRALNLKLSAPVPPANPAEPNQYFKGSPLVPLAKLLETQGHLPFAWPFPDGFPDKAETWTTLSSQVQRWNLVNKISLGRMGTAFADKDFSAELTKSATNPDAILSELSIRFYGKNLATTERNEVLKLLRSVPQNGDQVKYINKVAGMATALLMSKPEWNLR